MIKENMNLMEIAYIKRILSQAGLRPKKDLGQHFLISGEILAEFIKACQLGKGEIIAEVGSGLGVITQALVKKPLQKIYAFEIDPALYALLQEQVGEDERMVFINEDFLDLPRPSWGNIRKVDRVVGSIPYQITSPLIHKLIIEKWRLDSICLIVQKEMAEKIVAEPPQASYLSNFVRIYGQAEIVGGSIPPSAFWPQPKIHSTILRIRPTSPNPSGLKSLDTKEFLQFLHQGFSYPRKMLNKVFSDELLKKVDINPRSRPQEIELNQWLDLFCQRHRFQKAPVSRE